MMMMTGQTARVGRSPGEALRAKPGGEEAKSDAQRDHIPEELICSITKEVMKDPWQAADGFSYERTALAAWLEKRGTPSYTIHPTRGGGVFL